MSALDLLHKYLEYNFQWSRTDLLKEKPSIIRRQQIESLLKAFKLTKKSVNPLVQIVYSIVGKDEEVNRAKYLKGISDLEYFVNGEFLNDRPEEENSELTEIAINKILELYKDSKMDGLITRKPIHINWMFNSLLIFRQDAFNTAYPNGGMMEGFSTGLIYSKHLQSKVKKAIDDSIGEIDETLCLIIDPQKREVSLDELKSYYNYPDADLESIELEWTIDNY